MCNWRLDFKRVDGDCGKFSGNIKVQDAKAADDRLGSVGTLRLKLPPPRQGEHLPSEII
jgi:hypothetical protein